MTQDVVGILDVVMVQIPWLFVVWMTGVGGAIGSFLNVVVYRMPAGLSISHPPSRCPKCETPIRAYDNVPVIGWLVLGGKCRTCQLPIASRYPIVELTVAVLFGTLAFATVSRTRVSADVLIDFLQFLYYANAVACLTAFALIDFDGHYFPRRLVGYALLTVLIPPACRDDLRIWLLPSLIRDSPIASTWVGTVSIVALHASWAAVSAFFASWRMHLARNFVVSSAFVGVLLGWLIPTLPLILVSVVFVSVQKASVESEETGLHHGRQRILSSPVLVLSSLTYLFIVVQIYRGCIIYY